MGRSAENRQTPLSAEDFRELFRKAFPPVSPSDGLRYKAGRAEQRERFLRHVAQLGGRRSS